MQKRTRHFFDNYVNYNSRKFEISSLSSLYPLLSSSPRFLVTFILQDRIRYLEKARTNISLNLHFFDVNYNSIKEVRNLSRYPFEKKWKYLFLPNIRFPSLPVHPPLPISLSSFHFFQAIATPPLLTFDERRFDDSIEMLIPLDISRFHVGGNNGQDRDPFDRTRSRG